MTRCIPADPAFTTGSEREVWLAFKQRPRPDDALFANLRFTDERGDSEADLVVAIPGAGVAVIEVKGGSVWHDSGGWRMRRGGGEVSVNPVEQARRTMYALRDYLDRDPRWRRRIRRAPVVALPHTAVDAEFSLPACPRSHLLDRDDVAADPDALVRRVLTEQRWGQPSPSTADVDDLVEVLGGRMLPQRDLLAEAREREASVDLLTEARASILSALRLLHRVEVRGGAGSGKTWLAVEQARRLAADGRRVALLCYSRGLAAYLGRRVDGLRPRERPAYVGTFHYLGTCWGAPPGPDDDPDYFERRLPQAMAELAAARPDSDRPLPDAGRAGHGRRRGRAAARRRVGARARRPAHHRPPPPRADGSAGRGPRGLLGDLLVRQRPVLRARPRLHRGSSDRRSSWRSTASATSTGPGRCSTSGSPARATCSWCAATRSCCAPSVARASSGASPAPDGRTSRVRTCRRVEVGRSRSQALRRCAAMAVCEVCGNDYRLSFEVHAAGAVHTFDSFECAIHLMAPVCEHCGCKVIGHGTEADGHFFCCASCARHGGPDSAAELRDHAGVVPS